MNIYIVPIGYNTYICEHRNVSSTRSTRYAPVYVIYLPLLTSRDNYHNKYKSIYKHAPLLNCNAFRPVFRKWFRFNPVISMTPFNNMCVKEEKPVHEWCIRGGNNSGHRRPFFEFFVNRF